MDCLEAMREMRDNEFDLVFADVPYGIDEAKKVLSRIRPVKQKNGTYIAMKPLHVKKDWDKEYFDKGNERFAEHCKQPKLFAPETTAPKQDVLFAR